jgi:tetratricopeptide (TPR) repeat protein
MVSALATATLALMAFGGAKAATVVIGGLAGQCSSRAHAGRNDAESRDICTRAIAFETLFPHDLAGTYVNRGAMELGAGMPDAAHADFLQAIRIAPGMGEAHIGEGAYLVGMARFAEAESEIDHGLGLGSEEPEKGYYFRAMARWGQDNFKGAYDDFQRAIALKPGWSLPREQLKNFHVEPAR